MRRGGDDMNEALTKMLQQMMESGQEMVRAFNPALETMQVGGFDKLFPTMSKDMMEMWFGRTFNREGLDAKTRLLVTIAALTVLGAQAEAQMKLTIRHALEAGATQREIAEVIWQMSMFGGLPAMQKALEIAQAVFAETEEKQP
jgi:4-carboxymuconolactone decarboxylase